MTTGSSKRGPSPALRDRDFGSGLGRPLAPQVRVRDRPPFPTIPSHKSARAAGVAEPEEGELQPRVSGAIHPKPSPQAGAPGAPLN